MSGSSQTVLLVDDAVWDDHWGTRSAADWLWRIAAARTGQPAPLERCTRRVNRQTCAGAVPAG